MKRHGNTSSRRSQAGNTLVVAITILGIMALIAAYTVQAISARYKTAMRTAAWHESLLIAQSGVDMTLAQLATLLPNTQVNTQGLLTVLTPFINSLSSSIHVGPGGLSTANGQPVSFTPDPLVHGGEGATTSTATVTIDIVPLSQIVDQTLLSEVVTLLFGGSTPSVNMLRIRSKGTTYLPGPSRAADVWKADTDLLHAALVFDPITGKPVTQPNVTREIEALLKPVFPFENGVSVDGALNAPSASTIFDSYNSASSQSSTLGLYDPTKRLSTIAVTANSPNVQIGGVVYGNASTEGGNLVQGPHVTGKVNNSSYYALPPVATPSWSATPKSATGTTNISGGLLNPVQYTFTQVTGTLHVSGNLLSGLGTLPVVGTIATSEADIYVTGDFTGTIIVDPGVQVHLYVQGNANFGANGIQNASNTAANLQIYGVPATSGSAPTMTIDSTNNPVAAIYAPTHAVTLSGNGSFAGALTGSQVTVPGNASVHYDTSLALQVGPVIGYSLVSQQEIPAH